MSAGSNKTLKSYESPKGSGIKIRPIINIHNGETFGASYIVTVPPKLTGTVRKRKQFKTQEEAEGYAKETYDGSVEQGKAYFRLTDEERQEAIVWLPKLKEAGLSLSKAASYALEHLAGTNEQITVGEVAAELISDKRIRFERGDLRERSFRDFRSRSLKFSDAFEDQPIIGITPDNVKDWLLGLEVGTRSTKNYLLIVGEIFNHALAKGYLSLSPVARISTNDRKVLCGIEEEGEPAILSLEQAESLLTAAFENQELGMLPVVILGLFCGLRTEEIKRLGWSAVKEGKAKPIVTIDKAIAKKRRIRHVDIPSNAVKWLSLCNERKGQVVLDRYSDDFGRRFRKLVKLAGIGHKDDEGKWVSDWQINAMRHSFASYHYAMHGDSLLTSKLLGHRSSDSVLFDHYRALADEEDGKLYFNITPSPEATKVVEFAQ